MVNKSIFVFMCLASCCWVIWVTFHWIGQTDSRISLNDSLAKWSESKWCLKMLIHYSQLIGEGILKCVVSFSRMYLIVGRSNHQLVAGIQDLCHSTWQRSWAVNICCFGEWSTMSNDKQKQSGHIHCVLMLEVFLHAEAAMAWPQSGGGGRISGFSE